MTTEAAIPVPVTAREFGRWLEQTLKGKRLDPKNGHREGRVIFLLEDEKDACDRTDVVMTTQQIDVRHGVCGPEQLPEMTIFADTEAWLRYLEVPSAENLDPIRIFGNPYLYDTLMGLLVQKTSMVDLRASRDDSPAKKRRRRRKRS